MLTSHIKKISIIGDGSWGTTLAICLSQKGYAVSLWGPFAPYIREMRKTRMNRKFLPGIKIPSTISLCEDLGESVARAECIVLAIPSQYVTGILKSLKKFDLKNKIFTSVIKGIDIASLSRMSELIQRELGPVPLAVLSGPTIAQEVVTHMPTTAVIASKRIQLARLLQGVFNSPHFRIYTNRDVIGVELGGSLKNIIALACGVCDGLGFGTNAKAAILSRGLAEMSRLGVALGAKKKTFSGLSGLGDLVTTCFSPQSRNRSVGQKLGQGKKITEILSSMDSVAEGVPTVKAVLKLSRKFNISLPISTEVFNIIYRGKNPLKAVQDLMNRKLKSE